jgi:hypothetical protein
MFLFPYFNLLIGQQVAGHPENGERKKPAREEESRSP